MTDLSFNQKLANKVWDNPRFRPAMEAVKIAWLQKAAHLEYSLERIDPAKLAQSAAILACSDNLEHCHAAFNIATYIYDLFGTENMPLNQALRVVLARLKNFPSFDTRADVKDAEALLPLSLAIEEENAKSENQIIINEKPLYLTNFQHKLWRALIAGDNIALTAPTSAGKSFILQKYIMQEFDNDKPHTIVYLVPTRALISQVSKDIAAHFSAFTGDKPAIITMATTETGSLPERAVYILTQERLQLILSSISGFRADIIIVDEAHNISDGSRGVLLYGVITDLLKRNSAAQIIFAGPGIKNLSIFKETFALEEMQKLPTQEATVGQNFLITQKAFGLRQLNLAFQISKNNPAKEIGETCLFNNTFKKGKETLYEAALYFGKSQANIIYANRAADAEKYAVELAAKIDQEAITAELNTRRESFYEFIRETIHPQYKLAEAMRGGVGFHYGAMPSYIREMVEEAFSNGDIKYLCSTSTLLQGVNLPAQNIFIFNPKRGNGNPLQSVDFWNLAGRAGRLGKEFQGNIYLVDYKDWEVKPLEQPKEADITSAIAENIANYEEQLIHEIKGIYPAIGSDNIQQTCETVFTRLFTDYKNNKLEETFHQFALADHKKERLQNALEEAAKAITLPEVILAQNPTVSPRKQQKLFNYLCNTIRQGESDGLIPISPQNPEAYNSYVRILKACQEYILGLHNDTSTYYALLCRKWAKGDAIPKIIDKSIAHYAKKDPKKKIAAIIRETLKDIETEVRFQAVRLFNCHNILLAYALQQNGQEKLIKRISPLPTYLEIGACDQTAINLMSLEISRHTALKLMREIFRNPNLDLEQTKEHLKMVNAKELKLPEFCIREIQRVQKSLN